MLLFTGQTKNSGESFRSMGGIGMTDHRDYLDEQYKIAVLDYKSAHNEDEQWSARKRMAQTERTASELYGFDFADQLHQKYLGSVK
jgi:hypothetical protein